MGETFRHSSKWLSLKFCCLFFVLATFSIKYWYMGFLNITLTSASKYPVTYDLTFTFHIFILSQKCVINCKLLKVRLKRTKITKLICAKHKTIPLKVPRWRFALSLCFSLNFVLLISTWFQWALNRWTKSYFWRTKPLLWAGQQNNSHSKQKNKHLI